MAAQSVNVFADFITWCERGEASNGSLRTWDQTVAKSFLLQKCRFFPTHIDFSWLLSFCDTFSSLQANCDFEGNETFECRI